MFLKQTPSAKGTFLQIGESYYDKGNSRQRVIEKIGYVDQLKTEHDDPIAFFKEKAIRLTQEKKASSKEVLSINMNASMSLGENTFSNVGYVVLNEIYRELKLDVFWRRVASKLNIEFDLKKFSVFLFFLEY